MDAARWLTRGSFGRLKPRVAAGKCFKPTLADKRAVLLDYFDMLREDMPQTPAINRMKQLAGQFTRGLQGGALFRTSLYHSHTVDEILSRESRNTSRRLRHGKPYFGEAGAPIEE